MTLTPEDLRAFGEVMRDLNLVRVSFADIVLERTPSEAPESVPEDIAADIEKLFSGTEGDPREDDLAYADGRAPRFKRKNS